jgi:hypothetical protein
MEAQAQLKFRVMRRIQGSEQHSLLAVCRQIEVNGGSVNSLEVVAFSLRPLAHSRQAGIFLERTITKFLKKAAIAREVCGASLSRRCFAAAAFLKVPIPGTACFLSAGSK